MIYLDYAATSFPKPDAVVRAVANTMHYCGANPGRSGHRLSIAAGSLVMQAREALAQYLNVSDPFQIIFCLNCTDALNTAIGGVLRAGDHVVTTYYEHNSVLRPLHTLEKRGQISLSLVAPREDGRIHPEDIASVLRPNTRLVVVNYVSNVTGRIQPVSQIVQLSHAHGALCLVDGAQAAGHLPLDVGQLQADLVAMPGHKGLLGPQGTGVLYVREGLMLESIRQGGTGSESQLMLQPDDMPDRLEAGTLNLPGIAGLLAGIRFLQAHANELHAQQAFHADLLASGLRDIPGIQVYTPEGLAGRAGVVAFNLGQVDSGEVADLLDRDYNIACRAGMHCAPLVHRFLGTENQGAVRLSVGWATTRQEIEQCLLAVGRIAGQLG